MTTNGNGTFAVTVADTGVGIDSEDMARIGDPFFQARSSYDRRHDGTGLGLSICDRLVNLIVSDHSGKQFVRTSVQLVQEGDTRPELGSQFFCQWMEYQVNQAKKHAAE